MRRDSLKKGDIFGNLIVTGLSHSTKRKDGTAGERVMDCECRCGNTLKVRTSNLKSGNTKSCGCHHSEMTIKSNKNRDNVDNIENHIAYACGGCGSTSFSLLKSGSIECHSCLSMTSFKWETHPN